MCNGSSPYKFSPVRRYELPLPAPATSQRIAQQPSHRLVDRTPGRTGRRSHGTPANALYTPLGVFLNYSVEDLTGGLHRYIEMYSYQSSV